jgi:hypothetical protein
MNRDDIDIIRMAREVGLLVETSDGWDVWVPDNLEQFANVVAAAVRENVKHELLTLEKWKGLALANDGDGRTVRQVEAEARAAERERIVDILRDDGWLYCATMIERRKS